MLSTLLNLIKEISENTWSQDSIRMNAYNSFILNSVIAYHCICLAFRLLWKKSSKTRYFQSLPFYITIHCQKMIMVCKNNYLEISNIYYVSNVRKYFKVLMTISRALVRGGTGGQIPAGIFRTLNKIPR